jgi:stearoyl-CoA desaturase (Delta-9 desaturase)
VQLITLEWFSCRSEKGEISSLSIEIDYEFIFILLFSYHNYHHVFPYDYRSGEFGDIGHYNLSAVVIDFFAKIGWVYDRKLVSSEMIARRVAKSGDGTHFLSHEEAHKNSIYGYGDPDIDEADRRDLDKMKN